MTETRPQHPNPERATRLPGFIFSLLPPTAIGVVLLLTSTVPLFAPAWKYDIKRLFELWLLFAVLLLTAIVPALRRKFFEQLTRTPRSIAVPLLIAASLGVFSAWVNATTILGLAYSAAEVALLTLLVVGVYAMAAARALGGESFDRIALLMLTLLGVCVGMQELVGVAAAWASGLEFHPRIALMHFSWPRFYNQIQSWSIPVIAALPLLFPGKPLARVLCVASLALHWYVVIATGGRGTMLGVVSAIALVSLLASSGRRVLLRYHATGLVTGVLVYAAVAYGHGLLEPGPSDPNPEQPNVAGQSVETPSTLTSGKFTEPMTGKRVLTSSGRIAMWREAWHESLESPWLGKGPMNYACHGPVYRAGHPHSMPVQLMYEWGIPAMVLILIATLLAGRRLITHLRQGRSTQAPGRVLTTALATGVAAAGVHACLSGVLVMPASQLTGVLVGGWLLGSLPIQGDTGRASLMARLLLISAIALTLLLAAFAHREHAHAGLRLEQTPSMDRLIPRFWQNGKVCALGAEP
ncbi:O-antigen ligase family protein [Elongatibacter sediminis]|uniref:O-antigen ligase family protein n=1 Tax=Elongatibacter sediminis TaxID=3119006 RepID=A0AAW9RQ01_9GAMM